MDKNFLTKIDEIVLKLSQLEGRVNDISPLVLDLKSNIKQKFEIFNLIDTSRNNKSDPNSISFFNRLFNSKCLEALKFIEESIEDLRKINSMQFINFKNISDDLDNFLKSNNSHSDDLWVATAMDLHNNIFKTLKLNEYSIDELKDLQKEYLQKYNFYFPKEKPKKSFWEKLFG